MFARLGGGRHTDIGVFWTFGFDALRISQVRTVCQKQSNGNAPWDVYTFPSLTLQLRRVVREVDLFIGVGLSTLLVSTNWAMREPLEREASDRTGSTFLFVCNKNNF